MKPLTDEEKYENLSPNSQEFNGVFFTAVKSTGIYCLPSCTARRPKRENVEFYDCALEAEKNGYRACKRCLPNLCGVPWVDHKESIELVVPKSFRFKECLVYLDRSTNECLHRVKGDAFLKLLKFEDVLVLIKIESAGQKLHVTFLNEVPTKWVRAQVAKYVWDLFDLGTNLSKFYEVAKRDPILHGLVERYKGLRIVKIMDVFEGFCWAILGQQINLPFAYTLKRRFVEAYGEKMVYEDERYYLFPSPEIISTIEVEDLKKLQISTRKAEYIIGVAKAFQEGTLKKTDITFEKDYEALKSQFVALRGIGNWTADYVIMKCSSINQAFPIADVGIHNALKGILSLEKKPTVTEIEKLAENWRGWEAYVTFYLWRWLYD
ncbi:DNA-3-methyladenine glycosylase [Bacillus timonensis]|nr:DNA-3-methyladenine glycosylase [Bacillus timonensis]